MEHYSAWSSSAWILIALITLTVIFVIRIVMRRKWPPRMSKSASLAFLFVILGIFLGENRPLGNTLIGLGVALAVVDIYNQSRRSP